MALPQFITDPGELWFLHTMRRLSPDAREEVERLMRALIDKDPAPVVHAAARRVAYAMGASAQAATEVADAFMHGMRRH